MRQKYEGTPRERSNAASRDWKRRNKEHVAEKLRVWTERNKEHRSAYMKDYNDGRKEAQKAYDALRYLRPENVIKRAAKKAERKVYNAKWNVNNRDKHRATWGKRQARKRNNTIGNVRLIADWIKSWKSSKRVKCYWCLKFFDGKACEADHIIPLSKGGPHSIENMCTACEPCNMSKHDRTLDFWNGLIEQPVLF